MLIVYPRSVSCGFNVENTVASFPHRVKQSPRLCVAVMLLIVDCVRLGLATAAVDVVIITTQLGGPAKHRAETKF